MQVMRPRKGCSNGSAARATALPTVAALAFAAALAVPMSGCSSISTPLPEIKPAISTSMSQKDKDKAVDELNKVRQTHEQDAEKQIEQSR
jgi:ABC-type sugar transport system substrate-binding protein